MKKSFAKISPAVTVAASLAGFTTAAFAQTDTNVAAAFLDQAKASSDSQLGTIATELTGKAQTLDATVGTNSAVKSKLDSTLSSLAGGQDSAALTSRSSLRKVPSSRPNS